MEFCKKLCKKWIFFQNNSVENSLICPRTKSASHCLTELFPIYQNKHWTIRRRDDHIVVQSSHLNIFKIDWFLVYWWYLAVGLFWKISLGSPRFEPTTLIFLSDNGNCWPDKIDKIWLFLLIVVPQNCVLVPAPSSSLMMMLSSVSSFEKYL